MRARRVAWGLGGSAAVAVVLAAACGDDGGTNLVTNPSGARCAPTDPACPAISADCLALTDYAGASTFTLRMAQLSISRPAVLAQELLYNIIGEGVNINEPACNVSGNGTFCWLLQFDTEAGTLKTGGALPQVDPTAGYCFEYDAPNDIFPVEVDAPIAPDGSFEVGPIDYLSIPIYLDMAATSMVRLPLHDITITNAAVSADHNCIGQFNANGLDPTNNCRPDLDLGIEYFVNGAELHGYISLEEADSVIVEMLDQSLCVLLSGDVTTYGDGGSPIRCLRDGSDQIVLEGDWCSTTNSADGCRDAMRLAAGIAASAVLEAETCETGGGGSGGSDGGHGGTGGSGGATPTGGAGGSAGAAPAGGAGGA